MVRTYIRFMAFMNYPLQVAHKTASGLAPLTGALLVCALILLLFGLVLYPAIGPASFDPVLGFIGDVSPALGEALAYLSMIIVVLVQLTGFCYVKLIFPSDAMPVQRIRPLAAYWPALRDSNPLISPWSDSLLSASSSGRMVVPCAASASGASPQLE